MMNVCRHWNILPRKFRELGRMEKGELIAAYLTHRKLEAYAECERILASKRKEKEK